MPRYRFPELLGVPIEQTPEGMVGLGGDLSPENLLEAYRHGIFPWPISLEDGRATGEGELPLTWFSPSPRGVLEFPRLHIPKSLARVLKNSPFTVTRDQAFAQVIDGCARAPRPGQSGTWIIGPMLEAYGELHRLGVAHSFETWIGDRLVGGIYGVDMDGAFSAESMFHLEPNSSKVALLALVDHLKSRGLDWLDIQVMTPHLLKLGATEITRDEFLARLAATRARGLRLF